MNKILKIFPLAILLFVSCFSQQKVQAQNNPYTCSKQLGRVQLFILRDDHGDGLNLQVNYFNHDANGVPITITGTWYIVDDIENTHPVSFTLVSDSNNAATRNIMVLPPEALTMDLYVNTEDCHLLVDIPAVIPVLGGRVWYDLNSDKTNNPSESGIAGVAVSLTEVDGGDVVTTVTDINGYYGFLVTAGISYVVDISIPQYYDGVSSSGVIVAKAMRDKTVSFGMYGAPTFEFVLTQIRPVSEVLHIGDAVTYILTITNTSPLIVPLIETITEGPYYTSGTWPLEASALVTPDIQFLRGMQTGPSGTIKFAYQEPFASKDTFKVYFGAKSYSWAVNSGPGHVMTEVSQGVIPNVRDEAIIGSEIQFYVAQTGQWERFYSKNRVEWRKYWLPMAIN